MEQIKLGVLGVRRGKAHIEAAQNFCKNISVTAICDMDKEIADSVAAELNIGQVFYSMDGLFASDVDAVVIATPIPDHAEHVIAALKAGKHVLSEVHAATTLEDCERIAAAVKETGKKYMMAENYCYYRPLSVVHNMIKDGQLGDIYYAESDYLMDFHLRPGFPEVAGEWRKNTYFGTRGHPYITHSLGPLCFIMNERIASVTCQTAGDYPIFKADRMCILLLKTESGKLIRLRSSFLSPRPNVFTYYSFQGTKGCYEGQIGPNDNHRVHIRGLCGDQEWKNVFDFKEYYPAFWDIFPEGHFDDTADDCCSKFDSGLPVMVKAFADCIIHDTEPPIDVGMALNWTAAGILSGVSADCNGIPVEVPRFK